MPIIIILVIIFLIYNNTKNNDQKQKTGKPVNRQPVRPNQTQKPQPVRPNQTQKPQPARQSQTQSPQPARQNQTQNSRPVRQGQAISSIMNPTYTKPAVPKKQNNDILTKANQNVKEQQADVMDLLIPTESNLMQEISDLMVKGYDGQMSFSRDFVAEGIEMLNQIQM